LEKQESSGMCLYFTIHDNRTMKIQELQLDTHSL